MNSDTGPASPVGRLLRRAACVDDDPAAYAAIRGAGEDVNDWKQVVHQAERHGLAPYLYRQVTRAGLLLPHDADRMLKSLSLRHQLANRIRDRALAEMLDALTGRGIDVLVLKGAALAHLVYDPPGLRPMSDIDLLVAPDRPAAAADALRALGYRDAPDSGLAAGHHHLCPLVRTLEGLSVSVEIHHDALAPDNIGSIRMDNLSEAPREFRAGDATTRALGHIDMLRHLWRHALQPRSTTKLGSALDIMLYADRFADEIDWARVERGFPELPAGLSLLSHLVPLPRALAGRVPDPVAPAPTGVGIGMAPLSAIRHRRNRAASLFNPSDWWLHGFYNVPPGRSLVLTKTVRHPARLLAWLWRRARNRA